MNDYARFASEKIIDAVRMLEGERGEAFFNIVSALNALAQTDKDALRQVAQTIDGLPEAQKTLEKYRPKEVAEQNAEAVIYCRSATIEQVEKTPPYSPQEDACREYAKEYGLTVREVFQDFGNANDEVLPGLGRLLNYLEDNTKNPPVVLVQNASRLSRSTKTLLERREAIEQTGAALICLDTADMAPSTARFVETITAARTELEDRLSDTPDQS